MRVAFVVAQFPNLSETFILRQITGLLDRGYDVDIFAQTSTHDDIVHEDVTKYKLQNRTHYFSAGSPSSNKICRVMQRCGLLAAHAVRFHWAALKSLNPAKFGKEAILLRVLYQIAPFLDKRPYDILHCQFGPLGQLGLLLKDVGIFHGKLVTSFRGYDISSYVCANGPGIYTELFRRGDLFLCVSSAIKHKLISLGCDEQKIVVHRSGIYTHVDDDQVPGLRADRKLKILTVARLVEKKGIEYGIRAVAQLIRRRPMLEYEIAGEGPLRNHLEKLIRNLRAGSHIKMLGWKTEGEISELLKDADILLAPSITSAAGDEEGIPGAIMEAFAYGLPVVSTIHAGIPEVVRDGESGFLVPEKDPDALARKLEYLIEEPTVRVKMGRCGRKFVQQHHDIGKLNDRLAELYQQLVSGKLPHTSYEAVEPCAAVTP